MCSRSLQTNVPGSTIAMQVSRANPWVRQFNSSFNTSELSTLNPPQILGSRDLDYKEGQPWTMALTFDFCKGFTCERCVPVPYAAASLYHCYLLG